MGPAEARVAPFYRYLFHTSGTATHMPGCFGLEVKFFAI